MVGSLGSGENFALGCLVRQSCTPDKLRPLQAVKWSGPKKKLNFSKKKVENCPKKGVKSKEN